MWFGCTFSAVWLPVKLFSKVKEDEWSSVLPWKRNSWGQDGIWVCLPEDAADIVGPGNLTILLSPFFFSLLVVQRHVKRAGGL